MGYRRPLKPNEEVVVSSGGVLPKLDLRVGVVTGNTERSPKGWLKYEVFFPELDETYMIYPHYLAPIKEPTGEQRESYFHYATKGLMRSQPDWVKEMVRSKGRDREVGQADKEWHSLSKEQRLQLRMAKGDVPEDIEELFYSLETGEEKENFLDMMHELGYLDIGSSSYDNWAPLKEALEKRRRGWEEESKLWRRLEKEIRPNIPDYWGGEGS